MTHVIHFNSQTPEYDWLSNFYLTPILYDSTLWPSAEHAYQAAKTHVQAQKEQIRQAPTPALAKKLGRKVTLRPGWAADRQKVMMEICTSKFEHSEELKQQLIETEGYLLVEHSPWGDRYWGDGGDGCGENYMGRILMLVREFLLQDRRREG